ncbi:acetate/propionate family kinase [Halomonas organivorans]|uniref:Acetate kinase n=1 Tax=Halomonas organivorans TaxID=257772 RepID=A0A7W5BYB9_9GAMM|nr:acetate/propionate family kinase [Halomonas organivorans]MBB3141301.1 acetate kinase [Halomonas organivorans]
MLDPILVINCGSSSLKYALVPAEPDAPRLSGLVERLGGVDARLVGTDTRGATFAEAMPGADHRQALATVLTRLEGAAPLAVGHRVVHGGERFVAATRLDDGVLRALDALRELAPLHLPANLAGIAATRRHYPGLPQVAVFDTAFHRTLPPRAYRYALPESLYRRHGIRRYGFHGSNHAHVSRRLATLSGTGNGGWLIAHLGNGCSACAVWQGESVDTSMGLTPLEGLVMGTRSGDVDPGLHSHLARRLGWSLARIDRLLYHESGLLGLSGLSHDMRRLEQAAAEHHEGARLAIEVFCYRVAKALAALSCALPRLDGIAFTGGIGEHAAAVRASVIAQLPHFGARLDAAANAGTVGGRGGRIDAGRGPELWVIPADEEAQIAAETRRLLETSQP